MVDSNLNIAAEIAAIRAILSRAGDRLQKSNRALHQFLDDVARAKQAVERSRQLLKTGPQKLVTIKLTITRLLNALAEYRSSLTAR
jgi:hypothetical protein